jgi:hypothetical protein
MQIRDYRNFQIYVYPKNHGFYAEIIRKDKLIHTVKDIEHTKTKVKSPQTNGICERVHQTILNEFYRVFFRKKVYSDIETLQVDLDEYMQRYNFERTHQGKRCLERTPMDTFIDGKVFFKEKNLEEKLVV